jgi:hypothetical protein
MYIRYLPNLHHNRFLHCVSERLNKRWLVEQCVRVGY